MNVRTNARSEEVDVVFDGRELREDVEGFRYQISVEGSERRKRGMSRLSNRMKPKGQMRIYPGLALNGADIPGSGY